MTTHLLNEELIGMTDGLKIIPGSPSIATGFRIVLRGARGVDGQLHKLETIKVCGRRWTSREAIQRWLAAINTPAATVAPPVSPITRNRQKASAREELQELLTSH